MGVQVAHENIMRWLYTLHLRAPGATVVLVANKCDVSLDDFKDTTEIVEGFVKRELNEWQECRRSNRRYTKHPNSKDVTTVRLLDGISRISCNNYGGIDELQDCILNQDAASIQVPPAWDLALKVVEALRTNVDPLHVAWNHLKLNHTGATDSEASQMVSNTFTTKDELFKLWNGIVREVSGELEGAKQAAVSNPDSALNGALWIR